jgi:hypothetical protein
MPQPVSDPIELPPGFLAALPLEDQPTLLGDTQPAGDWTLNDARQWLHDRVEDGAGCPCCEQLAKVYRRPIHRTMAIALILMHQAQPTGDWLYLPEVLRSMGRSRGGDEAKLSYWGFIQEEGGIREDGSNRAGWWRVTDRGRLFVHDGLSVPRHAVIYDGQLLGFAGESVSIRDALGNRFDYDQLMAGEG